MFGSRLRMARERVGLNQTELGRLIGVEQQQVGRWENDKNQPSFLIVTTIAKVLDVSTDFLAGLTDEYTGTVSSNEELTPIERRALLYWRHGDIVGAIKAIVGE